MFTPHEVKDLATAHQAVADPATWQPPAGTSTSASGANS